MSETKQQRLEYDPDSFSVEAEGSIIAELLDHSDFPCADPADNAAFDASQHRYGHLFAAAPSLLAACEAVMELIPSPNGYDDLKSPPRAVQIAKQVAAAIASAKGETK